MCKKMCEIATEAKENELKMPQYIDTNGEEKVCEVKSRDGKCVVLGINCPVKEVKSGAYQSLINNLG